MKKLTLRFIRYPKTGRYIFQSQIEEPIPYCGAIPYSFLPLGSSLIIHVLDNWLQTLYQLNSLHWNISFLKYPTSTNTCLLVSIASLWTLIPLTSLVNGLAGYRVPESRPLVVTHYVVCTVVEWMSLICQGFCENFEIF